MPKIPAILLAILVGIVMYFYYTKTQSKVISSDTVIGEQKNEIVMYYHPECGHCTTFKPVFKDFKAGRSHVKMIDCEKEQCEGIRGFPTVLGFKEGKPVEYNGDRTKESLIKFENSLQIVNGSV